MSCILWENPIFFIIKLVAYTEQEYICLYITKFGTTLKELLQIIIQLKIAHYVSYTIQINTTTQLLLLYKNI